MSRTKDDGSAPVNGGMEVRHLRMTGVAAALMLSMGCRPVTDTDQRSASNDTALSPSTRTTPTSAPSTSSPPVASAPQLVATGQPGEDWHLARLGPNVVAYSPSTRAGFRVLEGGEPKPVAFWPKSGAGSLLVGGGLGDALAQGKLSREFIRRTGTTWKAVPGPAGTIVAYDGTSPAGYLVLVAHRDSGRLEFKGVGNDFAGPLPLLTEGTQGCPTRVSSHTVQMRRAGGHTFLVGYRCDHGRSTATILVEHWKPGSGRSRVYEPPLAGSKGLAFHNLSVNDDGTSAWLVASSSDGPAIARFDGVEWQAVVAPTTQRARVGALAQDGAFWLTTETQVWRWWLGTWTQPYQAAPNAPKPLQKEAVALSKDEFIFIAAREGAQRQHILRLEP